MGQSSVLCFVRIGKGEANLFSRQTDKCYEIFKEVMETILTKLWTFNDAMHFYFKANLS